MTSVGLQAPATAIMASLQHTSLLSNGQASSSPMYFGRSLPFRVAVSPVLRNGCKGLRNTQRASSSSRRYFVVVRASTAIVDPLSDAGTFPNMVEEEAKIKEAKIKQKDLELLACPVCFEPLSRKGIPGLNFRVISRSGFQCPICRKAYSSRNGYLDLTVTANAKLYNESKATGTELFRSPFVSFAYERGWRQSFQRTGFPGPDEEVQMAQKYLKPSYGGVLLDVSCGSGLFTRRFAKLDLYTAIIAIDFSENMLRQTYEYIKQDDTLLHKEIALVRADVARMPFATGSIDAVHAGAALHCWASPAAAVAEISRILRPGGVFVGTTFVDQSIPFNFQFLSQLRQAVEPNTQSSSLRYWQEAELEDLMRICGLVNYQCIRRQGFIMISVQKPE